MDGFRVALEKLDECSKLLNSKHGNVSLALTFGSAIAFTIMVGAAIIYIGV